MQDDQASNWCEFENCCWPVNFNKTKFPSQKKCHGALPLIVVDVCWLFALKKAPAKFCLFDNLSPVKSFLCENRLGQESLNWRQRGVHSLELCFSDTNALIPGFFWKFFSEEKLLQREHFLWRLRGICLEYRVVAL